MKPSQVGPPTESSLQRDVPGPGPGWRDQQELDFQSTGDAKGHQQWMQNRKAALRELARAMGLPLGHPSEVRLISGITLRGRLLLKEELLFIEEGRPSSLELLVDGVEFGSGEIESCIRLDD